MCIFAVHITYKIMIIYISYTSRYFMNYSKLLKINSIIPIGTHPNQRLSQSAPNLSPYQNFSKKDVIKITSSKKTLSSYLVLI